MSNEKNIRSLSACHNVIEQTQKLTQSANKIICAKIKITEDPERLNCLEDEIVKTCDSSIKKAG